LSIVANIKQNAAKYDFSTLICPSRWFGVLSRFMRDCGFGAGSRSLTQINLRQGGARWLA
jgi:hypothetical protein